MNDLEACAVNVSCGSPPGALPNSRPTVERVFYANLDVLRGLCALLVALFHVTWTHHLERALVVQHGWVFVDLFFVLSGFIMFQTYSASLHGRSELARFFIKRLFRLYPLHIVTALMFFALQIGREVVLPAVSGIKPHGYFQEGFGTSVVLNLFLLQGMGLSDKMFLNAPSWSISTEFWTYVVFAIVCVSSRTTRRRTFGWRPSVQFAS